MNEVVWAEDTRNQLSSIHGQQSSQHVTNSNSSSNTGHHRVAQQQQHQNDQLLTNGTGPVPTDMSARGSVQQQQSNQHQNQSQIVNNVNGNNQANVVGQQPNSGGPRASQDDAMVGYFFQRPQTDPDFQNFAGGKQARWALGDDTMLESRPQNESELESDFQALALETENFVKQTASTKKLWGVEENVTPTKQMHPHQHDQETPKSLFLGGGDPQWRDPTWSTGGNASEHAVSQPIMMGNRRSGSFPGSGDGPSMLSPRSTDTGGLGVKMVEYVLGTSPTNKDLETRMGRLHINSVGDPSNVHDKHKKNSDKVKGLDGENGHGQSNGMLSNGGLDEDSVSKGLFNRAPRNHYGASEDELKADHAALGKMPLNAQGGPGFDSFDGHLGMDQLQFNEYASQLMHSIDSPGMLDYNNPIYHQQRNSNGGQGQMPPGAPPMLHHGQGYPGAQQPPPGGPPSQGPFPQNPYYQDPFAAQMGHLIPAGPPAMMPPYYGMAPWGMYPPNTLQGQPGGPHMQQQAMMARNSQGRPLTPTGSGSDQGNHNGQMQSGQYPPMMPPHGYYDQNGMVMGNQGARGMNPAMMHPAMPRMLVNPSQANASNLRMMANGQNTAQNHNGPPPLFASNNNSNGYAGSTNSALYQSNGNSNALPNGNGMSFNHVAAHNGSYGGGNLGPIGAGLGSMGSLGTGSPRRDSFDGRRDSFGGMLSGLDGQFSRHVGKNAANQYYPMGSGVPASPGPIGIMPSQSPPPSMNGNMGLGNQLSQGRMSAAPGAEGKYLNRGNGPMGGRFSSANNNIDFPNRVLQRNSSIDKSTGRSRLLEDFRNNRHPTLQLRDLNDHIVEFSQDQHGSRFIQQKLERATPAEKQLVFNEIIGAAYNLMTDVFGNYVIQKFFEFGSPEQKQALAMKVKGHVLPLALQMYGCRVIQKALESIPPDQQKDIVKELDGHVLKCVKDQNGNHVVQKCIECVDPHALQFIIGAFQNQVFTLSTHPYGCRVIQRILEHCTPEQTAPILEELHSHTEQLVQDQYGNYVIQHVLEHGRPEDKSKLIQSVRGKVLTLSQHKFASNVVEKCVCHASRQERAFLIDEVCAYLDSSSHSALYTMMKDQYANYVVQKMIEVAEPPQRKALLQRIRPQVAALRKYTYGKHILAKLEKYIMKNSNELGPIGAPPNGNL